MVLATRRLESVVAQIFGKGKHVSSQSALMHGWSAVAMEFVKKVELACAINIGMVIFVMLRSAQKDVTTMAFVITEHACATKVTLGSTVPKSAQRIVLATEFVKTRSVFVTIGIMVLVARTFARTIVPRTAFARRMSSAMETASVSSDMKVTIALLSFHAPTIVLAMALANKAVVRVTMVGVATWIMG
jgi:hypothetical protein